MAHQNFCRLRREEAEILEAALMRRKETPTHFFYNQAQNVLKMNIFGTQACYIPFKSIFQTDFKRVMKRGNYILRVFKFLNFSNEPFRNIGFPMLLQSVVELWENMSVSLLDMNMSGFNALFNNCYNLRLSDANVLIFITRDSNMKRIIPWRVM